jgi:hypothetical protein
MALEDELEPKLNEISRLALDWYAQHLSYWGWEFDRYGNVVERPGGPPLGAPPANPQQMKEEWERFRDNLNQLLTRFRNFYGTQGVYWMYERLGGSIDDVGSGASTTVHGRLTLAYDPWVLDVGKMVETDDWKGDAARTFDQQFNVPIRRAVALQMAFVRELAVSARIFHDAMNRMHKIVLEVADSCIEGLRNRGWTKDQVVYIVSAASLAFGAYGMFASSAAAGWASVATGGAGFAMTQAPREKTTPPSDIQVGIGGGNPPEVIVSANAALVVVEEELTRLDDELSRNLDDDLKSTKAFEHPGLRLPRPGVASGESRFTEMKRGSAPGVPISEDEVVVSIVKLYQAGNVNLAIAADQYAAAAGALDSCTTPAELLRFFPRSVPKFDQARDLLRSILTDTRTTVTDVGTALMQMATNYQLTDDKRAEVTRQISAAVTRWEGDEEPRIGGV